ncbi:MAG: winged helix-turn-helix transcriptional regulator [Limnochordales bacterium]|nr:winged helix-turn-helix transcriptional regulator [Limnochordales bacterium]
MRSPDSRESQASREGWVFGDAPVCEVNVVHDDLVAQLKPEVEQVAGVAHLFKALADETRAKIIYALSQAELCVCDVAALVGASKATASYHLRLLSHLGLARYRREGKLVYYRLADGHVVNLVNEALKHVAEQNR